MTQSRDQFVKTVKKAVLCDTGHLVSIVKITERRFEPYDTSKRPNERVQKQCLRKFKYIEIKEPIKNYETLTDVYENNRREMPFKWIKITTRSTPKVVKQKNYLKNKNLSPNCTPVQTDDIPFWPTEEDKQEPFHFKMVAEDWDGNVVSFERPLLCVPIAKCMPNMNEIVDEYNKPKYLTYRIAELNNQPIAFAETDANSKGKTTLESKKVTFKAQYIEDNKNDLLKEMKLPFYQPRFLPEVEFAEVFIPAAEQVAGRKLEEKPIQFDDAYLTHGFTAGNKAEVFATSFVSNGVHSAAEKAGRKLDPKPIEFKKLS